MKKLFPLVLFLALSIGKISAQSETDSIPSKVIFYMPSAASEHINKIKAIVNELPEVTDASFISGNHYCLVLDIDKSLGDQVNYYSDITKRLSVVYRPETLLIKSPSAFPEIMTSVQPSDILILK